MLTSEKHDPAPSDFHILPENKHFTRVTADVWCPTQELLLLSSSCFLPSPAPTPLPSNHLGSSEPTKGGSGVYVLLPDRATYRALETLETSVLGF